MSGPWTAEKLDGRFAEMLAASVTDEPQIITCDGRETAVLVSIETWREMRRRMNLTIKEWLLAPEARGDIPIPSRKSYEQRSLPDVGVD